jgi:hypothetical protein
MKPCVVTDAERSNEEAGNPSQIPPTSKKPILESCYTDSRIDNKQSRYSKVNVFILLIQYNNLGVP